MKIGSFCFSVLLLAACSQNTSDRYLRSLKLEAIQLAAMDSVIIDDSLNVFPFGLVCADENWVVLEILQSEDHLLFLNTNTGERFFAIKKGRGPGEMLQGDNLQRIGGEGGFYDMDNGIAVSFDLRESIESKRLTLDTIMVFSEGPLPVDFIPCGDGFISGNRMDPDSWYSFFDSTGAVTSSVPAIWFEDVGKDRDAILSFLLSSKYVAHPDGSRVCVASVGSPSLSFAKVTDGRLEEYYRLALPPTGMRDGGATADNLDTFCCLKADDEHVCMLYSGNKFRGGVLPSYECRHLLVYGWDGKPRRHYVLDKNINNFTLHGGRIVGTSSYPSNRIIYYDLPEDLRHDNDEER